MKILLKLSSTLRKYVERYDPIRGLDYEAPDGRTVGGILEDLGIPPEKVKVTMINGHHAPLDTVVKAGDRLGVFPSLGGG